MAPDALYTKDKINEAIITTIASGETTSDIKNLGGSTLIAIDMPASFEGTSLQLRTGETPDLMLDSYDTLGNLLTIVAGSSRRICFAAQDCLAIKYIQLVGDVQSGDAAIKLITRPL